LWVEEAEGGIRHILKGVFLDVLPHWCFGKHGNDLDETSKIFTASFRMPGIDYG